MENIEIKNRNFYKNGELYNGEYFEYFTSGSIKTYCNVKNGKIQGRIYKFYENGIVKFLADFNNGQLNGDVKSYYSNGNIKTVRLYHFDKIIFEAFYYINGIIKWYNKRKS